MDNITSKQEEVKGRDGDGSEASPSASRSPESAVVLKAGRCYVGESGKITNPVQWKNLGNYFVSYEIEHGLFGSIQGRWNSDGSPVSENPDSLTRQNFGALRREASARVAD